MDSQRQQLLKDYAKKELPGAEVLTRLNRIMTEAFLKKGNNANDNR